MNRVWFLIGIVIIVYFTYRIIYYFFLPKPPQRIGPEQVDLSRLKQIISSEDLKTGWTSTQGSTLLFYIYPLINDRTTVSGNEYASVVQIGTKQNFSFFEIICHWRSSHISFAFLCRKSSVIWSGKRLISSRNQS